MWFTVKLCQDICFNSGLTNIRSYDCSILSLDQQLPVCTVFIISGQAVHTLQVGPIVWIIWVGEPVQQETGQNNRVYQETN